MYVFQFMDASWRIARQTNTKFPLPIAGKARTLFDQPYKTEKEAYAAMRTLRCWAGTSPEMFVLA